MTGVQTCALPIFVKEQFFCFSRVWGHLDNKTRYLLESKYVLGKSTSEIAIDLDWTSARVRTEISRARAKVRKRMNSIKENSRY